MPTLTQTGIATKVRQGEKLGTTLPRAFNGNYPNVIVISGTFGAGKSTITRELARRYDIPNVVEIVTITRTLRTYFPNSKLLQNWNHFSLGNKKEIIQQLYTQAQVITCVINKITELAIRKQEGTIITGVNILAEYLDLKNILYCALEVSDKIAHEYRFLHPFTKLRHFSNPDFTTVNILEREIIRDARKYKLPVIDNSGTIAETIHQIQQICDKAVGVDKVA